MGYEIETVMLPSLNLRKAEGAAGSYEIVIPERCNIARNTVERFARERPDHPALIFEHEDHTTETWSFAEVNRDASRLAHALRGLGISQGDRVALHTGMRPETGIAHMALHKLGAVAVTLSQLYGPDTLKHILNHAEAKAIITQDLAWDRFRGEAADFQTLKHCLLVGEAKGNEISFAEALADGPDSLPAIIPGPRIWRF